MKAYRIGRLGISSDEANEPLSRHLDMLLGAYVTPTTLKGVQIEASTLGAKAFASRAVALGRAQPVFSSALGFTGVTTGETLTVIGRASLFTYHLELATLRAEFMAPSDSEAADIGFDLEYPFEVLLAIVFRLHGLYYFHASCLADPAGRNLCVMGNSGAGKSTLSAYLVSRGWKCASDNWNLLEDGEDGLCFYGIKAALSLTPQSRELVQSAIARWSTIGDRADGSKREFSLPRLKDFDYHSGIVGCQGLLHLERPSPEDRLAKRAVTYVRASRMEAEARAQSAFFRALPGFSSRTHKSFRWAEDANGLPGLDAKSVAHHLGLLRKLAHGARRGHARTGALGVIPDDPSTGALLSAWLAGGAPRPVLSQPGQPIVATGASR